jgi:ATP-dependent exoDNAse (exonuclease V) beta subunit
MPLVAVPLSSNLLNTHFRQEYINEIISQYIDNLNLTYVAFTRPKLRLYAYGQMYSTTQKGSPSISKISHLLSYIYDKVIDTNKSQLLCEDNTYTYRKADTHLCTTSEEEDDKDKESKKGPQTRQANYVSSPIKKRLTLRSRAEDDFSEDTPLETIDLGILMHEWLAAINTWHDAPTALERMVAIGRITPTQQSTMQLQLEQLQHLLQREGKEHWFTTADQILNEHDILSTTGKTQRPDRVMSNNNHATIIDYKFGKEHSEQYLTQMRHYIVLYEQMGYTVEAYIVYVAQQKIEQIQ